MIYAEHIDTLKYEPIVVRALSASKRWLMLGATVALFGCGMSQTHQGKELAIAYQNNSSIQPAEGKDMVINYQVMVSVRPEDNKLINGMGIPLNPELIVTADHVVDGLEVGDLAYVQLGRLGKLSQPMAAEVVLRSPETDLAYLKLVESRFEPAVVPKWCEDEQFGSRVAMSKLTPDSRVTTASGTVSGITKRPLMTESFNAEASKEGFPPNNMHSEPVSWILLHQAMSGGFSGGAIYDVNNQCVVAVSSLIASFNDLAEPDLYGSVYEAIKTKYWADSSKVIAFGVPMQTVMKLANTVTAKL
ncbi:serine protease [Pseudoalteromonas sp. MMG022]|uniref:S1 family peptidase n=1 Tax=Pseudoalteromonas sp. MMG022 TaxID=2909978 RepID=UPI001F3D9CBE|nr:serine protease [Pseudoalteromonas sp. MMG022]MCF6434807.1 serine protease [Pseudoalteromonas sp. MMG022]